MNKTLNRVLKEEKIAPQLRSEIHHEQVTLESKDATVHIIAFDYRYYTEPIVTAGITSVAYQSADGKHYKTHFVTTLKEYLQDPVSKLYIGVKLFVRAMNLPNKLVYPIVGELPVTVMGKGTSKYMGSLEDAIPVVPQNGTGDDDDIEMENDPPPDITNLVLIKGTYTESDGKGQTAKAYIEASWDPVIHNDLWGYDSDISENDNLNYDKKPDPKANPANKMSWMGLNLDTTYYIRVRAVDLAGNHSDWVEGSIKTDDSLGIVNPPTTVQISQQPPQGIVLNWVASTSVNVFGYEINRANVNHGAAEPVFADSSKIGETNTTFYLDNGLNVSQDYYYWVRAVSTDGHYSTWVESAGLQPAMITDLTAEANSLYDSLKQIDSNKLADNAVTASKIVAGAVTANKIATGALLTYNATMVNRLAENKLTFTVTPSTTDGDETLNINAGTVSLSSFQNGQWTKVSCFISGGSFPMSSGYYYYLYFIPNLDPNTGEPQSGQGYSLASSTSYPTDEHAVVVITAYALYSSNMGEYTIDAKAIGSTGTVINGDHITTGSITASNIKTGTLTSASGVFGSIDASIITTGTINANRISISSYQISDVGANADQTSSHRAADIANLHAQVDHGAGLYATSQYLGYFDNNGNPQAYIMYNGQFYFGGDANNYVAWNGSTLEIQGHLYSSSINGGTITGAEITTNKNNNAYMEISNGGSGISPTIQFLYSTNNGDTYNLYHFIKEDGGTLYITGENSAGIQFSGTSVLFYDGIRVHGDGADVDIGVAKYNSNYYLTIDNGLLIYYDRGIKFHGTNPGGSLWFDYSNNVFKYMDTDGTTIHTIQAT